MNDEQGPAVPPYQPWMRPDIEHPRAVGRRTEFGSAIFITPAKLEQESETVILSIEEKASPSRRYLPTFAELIDRMTIVQLKAVFIPENKVAYDEELALILHDIDVLLAEKKITAETIRAIAVLMLTNRVIWESEGKARAGGNDQDHLLKFSHSVNGIRNTAKNIISAGTGERLDLKIDSLAADLPAEFGNWKIW